MKRKRTSVLGGVTFWTVLVVLSCVLGVGIFSVASPQKASAAAGCGAAQTFKTVWKTDNAGTSNSTSITIPTTSTGYSYKVDINGDGDFADMVGAWNETTNRTGNVTIDFGTPGTYTIAICGSFPRISFNNGGDKLKLLDITQWGDNTWTSMNVSFYGCANLTGTFTDTPNLSGVAIATGAFRGATNFNGNISGWNTASFTTVDSMFRDATSFNRNIGGWNMSSVATLASMFMGATSFNQPIGSWNTSSFTTLASVFTGATSFNQPIGSWDTSHVTSMASMFGNAFSFNQNINSWNTSQVTTMSSMFLRDTAFNQPLNSWNTSNVTTMDGMFRVAHAFNQPLNSWDVSKVTSMRLMFGAVSPNPIDATTVILADEPMAFNQDLSSWNTGLVTNMSSMFVSDPNALVPQYQAQGYTTITVNDNGYVHPFNQNIGAWNMSAISSNPGGSGFYSGVEGMLSRTSLSQANYDATLSGWASRTVQTGVKLGAHTLRYCTAGTSRQSLATAGWTIADAGRGCFYVVGSSSLTPVDAATGQSVAPSGSSTQTNTSRLVRLLSSGLPLAEATATFSGDLDWSAVSGAIDTTASKSVVSGLATAPGVGSNHALFVPKAASHTVVVVCPNAVTLAEVTSSCTGARRLTATDSTVSIITVGSQTYWRISGLTGTGGISIADPAAITTSGQLVNAGQNTEAYSACALLVVLLAVVVNMSSKKTIKYSRTRG